jgi:iron complex transport system permease protein
MIITRPRSLILMISCFFLSIAFSLLKGSTELSLSSFFLMRNDALSEIIWHFRLPRTLTALTCGSLLALAGALMQLLLQNPLADPYALGISSGAALATLLLMLAGVSMTYLSFGTWFGALFVFGLIIILTRRHFKSETLLLIGIALACGLSAIISFILVLTPNTNLHGMLFFLSGDLNDAQLPVTAILVLAIGFIVCMLLAPAFNVLLRGEAAARALGLNTKKYRIILYMLSSLFTATSVTIAGCIGFLGLIIPHMARKLVGTDHRQLLPACALLGASFLMLADTVARTLFAPIQLPVGILTALIGVPVFIWLLIHDT